MDINTFYGQKGSKTRITRHGLRNEPMQIQNVDIDDGLSDASDLADDSDVDEVSFITT